MILDVYYQSGMFSLLCIIITVATPFVLYNAFKNNTNLAIKRNSSFMMVLFLVVVIFSELSKIDNIRINNLIDLLEYTFLPLIFTSFCILNMDLAFKKRQKEGFEVKK
jgi:hypothetical protein